MSTQAPIRPVPRRSNRSRAAWARVFALLVAVFVLAGQQRVFGAVSRIGSSSAHRFDERAPLIESQALRAEAALRVAPAPVFARLPWFPTPSIACRWPAARLQVAARAPAEAHQPLSHFHSKRRIPRMNSEEPPRA